MADHQKPDHRNMKVESAVCAAVAAESPERLPESRSTTGRGEPIAVSSPEEAPATSVPGTEYWLP
jgi:hypothetical protein